ncbi:hypothetical protein KIW84_065432 [Lathyrus oleraceus]|uniref:Reverse transcriptase domain-containing protein n=1 Tax=Pisum sativum TaxID=3888 RepID=A0A9D4WEC0_PEA|nr:hypothetical protein KIW84_065432 [Pisum sativum]
MFADDLILFGVTLEPQIQVAMSILSKFCAASGQKINMDKSSIIFFVNTPPTTRRLLTSKVSLKETTSLVKPNDFYIWKSIVELRPTLDNLSYWEVGNGSSINVWEDTWVAPNIVLQDHVQVHAIPRNSVTSLKDLISSYGSWNWNLLSKIFSDSVLIKLQAITPLIPLESMADIYLWNGSASGMLFVSSLYDLLSNSAAINLNFHWDDVWTLKVPKRYIVFI